ncbi:MAG: hypothetical protein OEM02_10430 [Desulfobulbaceae bacterium]|nr:hypothetical protein [Desulfobulbaceae bacterium]
MDVALFIIPENNTDNVDTSFKAKALATISDELLIEISINAEVDPLMSFLGKNPDDLDDLLNILDTDDNSSIYSPDKWFSTEDGLNTIIALKNYVIENPDNIPNNTKTIEDLTQFETILNSLAKENIRWHLGME